MFFVIGALICRECLWNFGFSCILPFLLYVAFVRLPRRLGTERCLALLDAAVWLVQRSIGFAHVLPGWSETPPGTPISNQKAWRQWCCKPQAWLIWNHFGLFWERSSQIVHDKMYPKQCVRRIQVNSSLFFWRGISAWKCRCDHRPRLGRQELKCLDPVIEFIKCQHCLLLLGPAAWFPAWRQVQKEPAHTECGCGTPLLFEWHIQRPTSPWCALLVHAVAMPFARR